MTIERHKCGCLADRDRERWLRLCAKHRTEFDERHARAAADYRKQHPQEAGAALPHQSSSRPAAAPCSSSGFPS